MLQALTDAILPIFAVMAIGFALGARGLVAQEAPGHINRFVLLVAVPSLLFGILSTAPLSAFDWQAIGVYAAGEATGYLAGFLIAHHVFRRAADEALLLGFAAAFVNHVLFVLPVAEGLYGEAAAAPIAAIVTVDALVTWPLTVVASEAITGMVRPPAVIAQPAGGVPEKKDCRTCARSSSCQTSGIVAPTHWPVSPRNSAQRPTAPSGATSRCIHGRTQNELGRVIRRTPECPGTI